MTVLHHTQEIDRPVADVFDVAIHAGEFASWNPTIKSSRQLSPDPIGEGTTFEWDLRGFGAVRQELQEFEPNRRVRIVPTIDRSPAATASPSPISGVEPASTTSSR